MWRVGFGEVGVYYSWGFVDEVNERMEKGVPRVVSSKTVCICNYNRVQLF